MRGVLNSETDSSGSCEHLWQHDRSQSAHCRTDSADVTEEQFWQMICVPPEAIAINRAAVIVRWYLNY